MNHESDDGEGLASLLLGVGDKATAGNRDLGLQEAAVDHRGRRRRQVSAVAAVVITMSLVSGIVVAVSRPPKHGAVLMSSPTPTTTSGGVAELKAGQWSALPAAPITSRRSASVVWTGRDLLVWGGESGSHGDVLHADGAAYSPQTGQWHLLPSSPLSPRTGQAGAWTGSELVIWGGYDQVSSAAFHVTNDGAAYNPQTNRWRVLPPSPLSARTNPVAVWTGRALVLLGGQPAVLTNAIRGFGDGVLYDPSSDRWTPIAPPTPLDGHSLAWRSAVQTDGGLLAWSEWIPSPSPTAATSAFGGADIFAYDESAGGWRAVPPAPGALPTAEEVIWTGSVALVRGGRINCPSCAGPRGSEVTDSYSPVLNVWTRLPADPLADDHNPLAGPDLASVWTGAALFSLDEMSASGAIRPGDASAYDPTTATWSRLPSAPFECDDGRSPIWTGQQILLYCPSPAGGPGAAHDGLAFTPG